MKILYYNRVNYHFHIPYLKYFKDKGYEVHVATSNDENEMSFHLDVIAGLQQGQ